MGREISSVGVVGLGTMGAGIVEVLARNGIDVVAVEITEAALERGRATLNGSLDRAVARGKLPTSDQDALLQRVRFAVGLESLAEVDLAIEAVPEQLDLKRSIFAALDGICKPEAILATNTSALSVTEISVATHRPNRVVGMHFFNPAPVMKLVEVVRTVVSADEVVRDIEALCTRLGKTDVTINDRAGFIANALLFGYLNHAVSMYEASLRQPRGSGRGDEARLRPADGSAGADGPHWTRHRLRDPGHDVPPGWPGPAARPRAVAQADGHRRAARSQGG